jgi:methylmalonyl-CoA mutase N-terminal domain/subunit
LNLPTEEAAGIALRTQQVAAFESGIADSADPLGGSYFVESLTNEVEAATWKLIDQIDAMGGSITAIEQGFIQNEIAKSAYEYQRKIESGEKIIVGVNKFKNEHNVLPTPFKIDDSIRQLQIDKLNVLKKKRDKNKAMACLKLIKDKTLSGENIMPAVIDAVENNCTLGEISNTLREVFGEYR